MDCRNIEPDLSALIDGELPAERQADVIEHVDNCPACSRRVAELQRLSAGIGALPKLDSPPQFLAGVRRKLRPAQRWENALSRPVWFKVPLEALAAVAIVLWLTRPRPVPVLVMNAVPSPSREMRARILPEEQTPAAPVANVKVDRGDASAGKPFAGGIGIGDSGANLIDALRVEPSMPVVVSGESLVAVRLRVTELAQMLNGQVEATTPSNTFVVRIPAGRVNEFRARLAQKPGTMYAVPAVEVKVIVEPAGK